MRPWARRRLGTFARRHRGFGATAPPAAAGAPPGLAPPLVAGTGPLGPLSTGAGSGGAGDAVSPATCSTASINPVHVVPRVADLERLATGGWAEGLREVRPRRHLDAAYED